MKYLSWVNVFLRAPVSRRKEWVRELIAGLKSYRKARKSPTTKYLSEVLESGSEYDLVGVSPAVQYIKVEGSPDKLDCIWQHAHMNPALLYKHKTLPVFIITGPGLRWNESILNEVGMSSDSVEGITG